jgi:hypothetical protein
VRFASMPDDPLMPVEALRRERGSVR